MYTHLFTLKVFCSVVESGSILKAAEELLLSQPAISLQIKNLESFYDIKFFDRTPRGLRVNQLGEVLYGYAKKLIEFHNEMHHEILRHTGKVAHNELRVAASTVPGICFLPKILRSFKEIHPTYPTKVNFEVSGTSKILEEMRKGEIDIAVVSHKISDENIQYEKFLRHPLHVVAPKGYLKAGNQQVSVKDLRGKDIILMKKDCDITRAWKNFLERYHVKTEDFHVTGVFDHISEIIRFLKEGVGLGILPECMVMREIENRVLERIRIRESGLYIWFSLAFKTSSMQNMNVYQFYKFLKSSFLKAGQS
jgi:DNA-binding transcriptional LysR family regulator